MFYVIYVKNGNAILPRHAKHGYSAGTAINKFIAHVNIFNITEYNRISVIRYIVRTTRDTVYDATKLRHSSLDRINIMW